MAKPKFFKSRKKRRRRNPEGESSPTSESPSRLSEMAFTVGAGFGGYAATRLVARLAHVQALKRWPHLVKHVTAAASLAGAGGAYLASRYWDQIAEHHDAITLGASVGAVQTLVQAYLPQYSWIVSDLAPAAPKPAALTSAQTANLDRMLNEGELDIIPIGQSSKENTSLLGSGMGSSDSSSIEDLAGDLAEEWKF